MNKNWYAVYTKAQCEKKVASQLTKKKIENFCPLNRRLFLYSQNNRKKIVHDPLFPSFVFVYMAPSEMPVVKRTNDVINFVYWIGNPAIIKTAEIENIDLAINSYYNINLEKTLVNPNGAVRICDEHGMDLNLGVISARNTKIKITLPSLGYIMIVSEVEKTSLDSFSYGIENTGLLT